MYQGYSSRRGLLKCKQAEKEKYFYFRTIHEKTGRKLIQVQNIAHLFLSPPRLDRG